MQRQRRRADCRGLGGSLSRNRAINADGRSHRVASR
jgi:hypothetical protein